MYLIRDKSLNYTRFDEIAAGQTGCLCTKIHSKFERQYCLCIQETPLGVKIQCVGGQLL